VTQGPPQPGEVIRYAYLWWHEARRGQEEGLKDRPCSVVVARNEEDGTFGSTFCPSRTRDRDKAKMALRFPPQPSAGLGSIASGPGSSRPSSTILSGRDLISVVPQRESASMGFCLEGFSSKLWGR
jgi:hypothetical protein